jgi:hypothetical protein
LEGIPVAYFVHPLHDFVRSEYGIVLPLAQKTCCIAAHSASAQVITTASATGSVAPEVVSNFGATCPTAVQLMIGSGGMFLISGLKLSCAALTNIREGL